MVQTDEYKATLYEDKWLIREDGYIQHNPLQNLPSISPKMGLITYGCLTFGGHDLEKSNLLRDVRIFYLEFSGELPDDLYREAWADPLRANVLKRLSGENRSLYISFVGDITERMILHDNRKVPDKLFRYLSEMDPARVATVMSEKPFGAGYGFEKRLFFEITNEEIEWAVLNIWPNAMEIYPIEGYYLPAGRMDLIRKWDQKPKDDHLFKEVLKNSSYSFFTVPAEHRDFKFVTLNLESQEFARLIDLEALNQKAEEIGRKMNSDKLEE